MNNSEQPKLLIPYFEYLRLMTWILASEPRRIICLGSLSGIENGLSVNRVFLPKQEQQNILEKQLDSIKWDMATFQSEMVLLVISDCMLMLPNEQSQTLDSIVRCMENIALRLLIIMLTDGKHQAVAFFTILKPILLARKLEIFLKLPREDESAKEHWLEEFKQSFPNQQASSILDNKFPPLHSYSFQYLPSSLFFTEPGVDMSKIKRVLNQ